MLSPVKCKSKPMTSPHCCQNDYYLKRQQIISAGENVEERGTFLTMLVGMYGAAMMENSTVWKVLKKLKVELPYNSAIPLLGTYPKKTKTLI